MTFWTSEGSFVSEAIRSWTSHKTCTVSRIPAALHPLSNSWRSHLATLYPFFNHKGLIGGMDFIALTKPDTKQAIGTLLILRSLAASGGHATSSYHAIGPKASRWAHPYVVYRMPTSNWLPSKVLLLADQHCECSTLLAWIIEACGPEWRPACYDE